MNIPNNPEHEDYLPNLLNKMIDNLRIIPSPIIYVLTPREWEIWEETYGPITNPNWIKDEVISTGEGKWSSKILTDESLRGAV